MPDVAILSLMQDKPDLRTQTGLNVIQLPKKDWNFPFLECRKCAEELAEVNDTYSPWNTPLPKYYIQLKLFNQFNKCYQNGLNMSRVAHKIKWRVSRLPKMYKVEGATTLSLPPRNKKRRQSPYGKCNSISRWQRGFSCLAFLTGTCVALLEFLNIHSNFIGDSWLDY